jgi:hypothetical protein
MSIKLKREFQMSKTKRTKNKIKSHTVRPAGLKTRRSFSYTTTMNCYNYYFFFEEYIFRGELKRMETGAERGSW